MILCFQSYFFFLEFTLMFLEGFYFFFIQKYLAECSNSFLLNSPIDYFYMCMYVCMCVCMCICVHVYVCMYCVYTYVYMCVCIVCICVYICLYVCACVCICVYVCTYVCICVYACTYVCMFICVYYVHMYVHMCVCMYGQMDEVTLRVHYVTQAGLELLDSCDPPPPYPLLQLGLQVCALLFPVDFKLIHFFVCLVF